MSDARRKWDARYENPSYGSGPPSELLTDNEALLPSSGRALDIACGACRNAIYLAERGLDVVGLDISTVGLRRAREAAEAAGVDVSLQLWDLERSLLPEGPFDMIACIHYYQPSLAPAIAEALAPGGLLVMETHTTANLQFSSQPSRRYLVEPNELLTWFPTLQLSSYSELKGDGRAVAQLIARKL
ncbi:MAG: SAM-dependent methyltransferase [Proteobacteria bacterium]|nr:MAG: SAM-dependent methyltransferase [Pseudomonadota bacterium]PIE17493.1 MAG: SAM-dependent methyltransferase [Pseudomonadota bacterium]